MTEHSYGVTLMTHLDDKGIEQLLDKKALADLKENSKPGGLALTHVASEHILNNLEDGDVFTLTDMFLILHQEGHTDTKMKSLQTILARLVRDTEFPLIAVKVVGRQRGYQKT